MTELLTGIYELALEPHDVIAAVYVEDFAGYGAG